MNIYRSPTVTTNPVIWRNYSYGKKIQQAMQTNTSARNKEADNGSVQLVLLSKLRVGNKLFEYMGKYFVLKVRGCVFV